MGRQGVATRGADTMSTLKPRGLRLGSRETVALGGSLPSRLPHVSDPYLPGTPTAGPAPEEDWLAERTFAPPLPNGAVIALRSP